MTKELGVSPLRMVQHSTALRLARQINGSTIPAVASAQSAYTGILVQPMSIHIGDLLNRKPYWWFGCDWSWALIVERIRLREIQAWQDRIDALGRWYGIGTYSEPNPTDPWHRLAFELLRAHVPGFALGEELGAKLPGRGAPPVLDISQTIRLAACVHDALTGGERQSGAIAKLALANFDFKVPRRGCGPRKGGHPRRRQRIQPGREPLSRQTATHLVKQMRSAWQDVLKGEVSAFQFQIVKLALVSKKSCDLDPDWGVVFGLRLPNNQ